MKVTIFKNIKSTSAPFIKDVTYALDRIKNGKSRETVDAIRYELNEEVIAELKKTLPSICFSGTFDRRAINGLKQHSGLICLDFDDFPDIDTMKVARETLLGDQYTFALWTSPSGNGIKLLVKIPPIKENHKAYFDALAIYYKDIPGFDKSTSDVSRVCYESYDPDLYSNPDSELWAEGEEVDLEGLGTEAPIIPIESENYIITLLMKWWEKKYGKTKGSRNTNCFILAAAFNDFGVDQEQARFKMEELAETGFSKKEIGNIIKSAYKKKESFGTRFFEDYATKRNIEKEVVNGKSVKQIEKDFPKVKNIEAVTEKIKDSIVIDEFWTFDDKGRFHVVDHKFKRYIQSRFVFKYFPNPESNPVFIQICENKVKLISVKQIKDMVLKDLETRPMIGMLPFDNMASQTKYFTEEYLSFLDTISIDLKKDTATEAYLYYRDKAIRVTKDSVDEIEYIDLGGYVWENQIIDRQLKKVSVDKCDFNRYLFLISGQDDDRYRAIRSAVGYLLHSFKTRANNKAIILNDEVISDNPNGGSGKGIFAQAIGFMRRISVVDGKRYNPDKDFALQTVSPDCQILVFDDVKKNFPFESIFSLITEGITLEKKNKDAIKIPVEESPKTLISTNYTLNGSGGSYERRKHELELSSYFGAHHTPLDEFGHMLFDDWHEAEWNLFDNDMIGCLQTFLSEGLMVYNHKNLHIRKFIKETSSEFHEWTSEGNLPTDVRFSRAEKFEELLREYPDLKNVWKLSQKRFKVWLDAYANFKKLDHKDIKDSAGVRWSMIKSHDSDDQVEDTISDVPF